MHLANLFKIQNKILLSVIKQTVSRHQRENSKCFKQTQADCVVRHGNKNDAVGSCMRGIIQRRCNRTPWYSQGSHSSQPNSENASPGRKPRTANKNVERLDPEYAQHARSLSVVLLPVDLSRVLSSPITKSGTAIAPPSFLHHQGRSIFSGGGNLLICQLYIYYVCAHLRYAERRTKRLLFPVSRTSLSTCFGLRDTNR